MRRHASRSLERPERWQERRRQRHSSSAEAELTDGGRSRRHEARQIADSHVGHRDAARDWHSPPQHDGRSSGSSSAALARHGIDRAIIKRLRQFDARGMLPWESLDESALSLLGRVDVELVDAVLDEWEARFGSSTPPRNHSAALVALVQRMRDERDRRYGGSYRDRGGDRGSSPSKSSVPSLLRRVESKLTNGTIDDEARRSLEDLPSETARSILGDMERKALDMKNPSAFITSRARAALDGPPSRKEPLRAPAHDEGGGREKSKGKSKGSASGGAPHPAIANGETYVGVIKSFNDKTNYGFIVCDEIQAAYGSDCFCAGRYMNGHSVGDTVEFDVGVTPQGKPQAIALRPVSRHVSESRSRARARRRRSPPARGDLERTLQDIVDSVGLDDRAKGMLAEVPLEEAMNMLEVMMERKESINCSAFITGAVRKYLAEYGSAGSAPSQRRAAPPEGRGSERGERTERSERGAGERGGACERRGDGERHRHRERYVRSVSHRRSRSRSRAWSSTGDAGRGDSLDADRMIERCDGIDDQAKESLRELPSHEAVEILREIRNKRGDIRNPSAYVVRSCNSVQHRLGRRRRPDDEQPEPPPPRARRQSSPSPIMQRVKQAIRAFQPPLDDGARSLLYRLAPRAAMDVLKDLNSRINIIYNPSAWVSRAAKCIDPTLAVEGRDGRDGDYDLLPPPPPRRDASRQQQQQQLLPGDWICRTCNDIQFARNTSCRRCGTSRDEPNDRDGDEGRNSESRPVRDDETARRIEDLALRLDCDDFAIEALHQATQERALEVLEELLPRKDALRNPSAVVMTALKQQPTPTRKSKGALAICDNGATSGTSKPETPPEGPVSEGVQAQIVELCQLAGLKQEATDRIKSISPEGALDILQSLVAKQPDISDTSSWVVDAVDEHVKQAKAALADSQAKDRQGEVPAIEDASGRDAPVAKASSPSHRETSRSRSRDPAPRASAREPASAAAASETACTGGDDEIPESKHQLRQLLERCASLIDDGARQALDKLAVEDAVSLVEDVVAKQLELSSSFASVVRTAQQCHEGTRDDARCKKDEEGDNAEAAMSGKDAQADGKAPERATSEVDVQLNELAMELELEDRTCEALRKIHAESAVEILQDVIRQGHAIRDRSAWVHRAACIVSDGNSAAQRHALDEELDSLVQRTQLSSRARQALADLHPADAIEVMLELDKNKDELRNHSAWVCWRVLCAREESTEDTLSNHQKDSNISQHAEDCDENDTEQGAITEASLSKHGETSNITHDKEEVGDSTDRGDEERAEKDVEMQEAADEHKETQGEADEPIEQRDGQQRDETPTKKARDEGWMSSLSIEDWLHEVDEGKGFLKPFASEVGANYDTVEQVVDLYIQRDDEGGAQFDPVFYEEIGLEKAEHREAFDRWAASHF
mmetsp:Transcript_15596/g.27834  ORF Transcript_15596/g.27834 Transcript_15596/m.27834 type:complete len:1408 (+) Transcript_15596:40-4263(+)